MKHHSESEFFPLSGPPHFPSSPPPEVLFKDQSQGLMRAR